jgi:hypothetical protein
MCGAPAPEALKAGERLLPVVKHFPGLVQQVSIVAPAGHSGLQKALLHFVIPHQRDGIVQVVKVHGLSTSIVNQLHEDRAGFVRAADDESRAEGLQLLLETEEWLLQPPAGASTRLELAFFLRSPDEDWYL